MDFDVELVLEGLALGFDALILAFLYKSYESCSSYIEALKEAQQIEIGQLTELSDPKTRKTRWWTFWRSPKLNETNSSSDCHYVCLRGKVAPIDKHRLLKSLDAKSSGVIHKVTTKEVAAVRNGTKFWVNEERIVKNVQHEIPWCLKSPESSRSSAMVQVVDGLGADRLDLATVRDEFIPSPFSFSSWVGGWLAGQQVKGTQEIEEMLIDGSLLTAVGEMIVSKDGSILLRSPINSDRSLPFILSTLPYNALLSTYETLINVCKWSCVFFGGLGAVIVYFFIRRWLRIRYGRRNVREENDILHDLQESRTTTSEESEDVPEWQRCVICLVRAREIIVLPCGHVCLCADCMLLINRQTITQRNCPMCRQRIEQIARAYVP